MVKSEASGPTKKKDVEQSETKPDKVPSIPPPKPDVALTTNILYKGKELPISGTSTCSITQSISQTQDFYELTFLEKLREIITPGGWALDIGAHIGNHTLFFSTIIGLDVMAFEAKPETYANLKNTLQANGLEKIVNTQNLAVSDHVKGLTLTPIKSLDPGTYSFSREPNEHSIYCRSVLLDSYLEFFQERQVKLIKLDIEGGELAALKGARKLINRHLPIITTEVFNKKAFQEIASTLSELRYRPLGIFNATPSIIWAHMNLATDISDTQVYDYAIDMAVAYNARSAQKKCI